MAAWKSSAELQDAPRSPETPRRHHSGGRRAGRGHSPALEARSDVLVWHDRFSVVRKFVLHFSVMSVYQMTTAGLTGRVGLAKRRYSQPAPGLVLLTISAKDRPKTIGSASNACSAKHVVLHDGGDDCDISENVPRSQACCQANEDVRRPPVRCPKLQRQ